ncbi:MAG: hypothetical protein GY797_35665 [Deltaproteobacteria bacterium]|nr:hypothetical protein [Deltaproteobacteria bacterium]
MIKNKHIAIIWGILDLLTIAWYVGISIKRGHFPIIHDISQGSINIKTFGFPNLTFLSYIAVLFYMSPLLSGPLLIFQKRIGLIIVYVQTPFRLIMIIPPSIFFILWPLNDSLSQSTVLWLGFILVFISESIKISTLIVWNKKRTK